MSHTPGPFTVLFNNKQQIFCAEIFDAEGPMHGMQVGCVAWTRTPGEGQANADLFRAAPDLLAALQCAVDCQPGDAQPVPYWLPQARAAIEKAKGKA